MTEQEKKPSFERFGQEFQKKVVQALIWDKEWARQMSEVLDVGYFDLESLKFVTEAMFQYQSKYQDLPSLEILASVVREKLRVERTNDQALALSIAAYLRSIQNNPNSSDLEFVKEKSLDFCKRQAFKMALEDSADLVLSDRYDAVVERIKKAIAAGMPIDIGHSLLDDFEARYSLVRRSPIATGLPQLDDKQVLNGGLGKGELGSIFASTGVGKSHFLTMLGANALLAGKIVFHYTMELSREIIGLRYDSYVCKIPASDVVYRKAEAMAKYKLLSESNKIGQVIIKEFPTRMPTISTLRSHVEKAGLARGLVPDLVIVDYADVMRSSRKYDNMRHELQLVYEELRGLAREISVPIWTASQTNRDSSGHEVVELKDVSESFGKAMVSDVVISISRKLSDRSAGSGRLHIAKNRAGRDGLVWNVEIDTAMSSFKILGEYSTAEDAMQECEGEVKSAMRDKWVAFEKEGGAKFRRMG